MQLLTPEEVDAAFAIAALDDAVVAKALGIGELAQLAKLEADLGTYIGLRWSTTAERAVAAAVRAGPRGAAAVERAVARVMEGWAAAVGPRFASDVKKAYRLARVAGARKGAGVTSKSLAFPTPTTATVRKASPPKDAERRAVMAASFDAVDEEALKALERQQLMWIGRHYDAAVGRFVAAAAERGIATGVGRNVTGDKLGEHVREALIGVKVPGRYTGDERGYFRGLAGNAMTVARANGQLRSFEELEFDEYEIVNPDDERTCPVCGHMNGMTFSVKEGRRVVDAAAAATTPEGVRAAHPWLTEKRMRALAPTSGRGTKGLARAGFCMPPFHFRCRCTVDIS